MDGISSTIHIYIKIYGFDESWIYHQGSCVPWRRALLPAAVAAVAATPAAVAPICSRHRSLTRERQFSWSLRVFEQEAQKSPRFELAAPFLSSSRLHNGIILLSEVDECWGEGAEGTQ